MPPHDQFNNLWLANDAFPQRRLLESYYDRDVTRLSDRGLASNLIGDRWSDVCALSTDLWAGTNVVLPDQQTINVTAVYRLDDIPQIARVASKLGLQNPDFIVAGYRESEPVIFSMDAKFSIDRAKSSQVSSDALEALLDVGVAITDHLPGLDIQSRIVDGYFLSPEMPLTHYTLGLERGRMAARVNRGQVMLLQQTPVDFIKPLPGSRLVGPLATMDGLRQEIRSNMLLALYYFRLVRACYGAYVETITPILGPKVQQPIEDAELESITVDIAKESGNSWQVVMAWDDRAEHVRRQRETIQAAMALPLRNQDIRDGVVREARIRGSEAPSINSVRRLVGSWYRRQFDEAIGTVMAPISDVQKLLEQIHSVAREIEPQIQSAFQTSIETAFGSLDGEQNTATGSATPDILGE